MSDIRKLLTIINESSAGSTSAGSVASVAQPVTTEERVEEDAQKVPEVIEYGNWENSALATTSKLKKNRGKSAKVVKSIYGEDVQSEAANPKQQAAIAIAKKKEVAEGKFTVNAKTGAKLDPRTGAELPPKEKPLTMKDMFRQPKSTAPKLTLDDVWMKIQSVVSNIYPDGDPIDHLAPWLEKHGIRDFKIGEILDRAAKKNGYKDLYDYWYSMGELPLSGQGVAEGLEDKTAQQRKTERDKQRTAPAQKARNTAQRKGLTQDKDGTYYAKEGVAEGSEQIDEVSMEKLLKYVPNAVADLSDREIRINTGKATANDAKKVQDRKKGLSRAAGKIGYKMAPESVAEGNILSDAGVSVDKAIQALEKAGAEKVFRSEANPYIIGFSFSGRRGLPRILPVRKDGKVSLARLNQTVRQLKGVPSPEELEKSINAKQGVAEAGYQSPHTKLAQLKAKYEAALKSPNPNMTSLRRIRDQIIKLEFDLGLKEGMAESWKDTVKSVGKKVLDKLAPDDEALLKDLQKKVGVSAHAQHGKKRMAVPNDEKLDEHDLILNPASMGKLSPGLVAKAQHPDHELEMAKSDLYQSSKNALAIFNLIKDRSEMEGLDGWVQEKITKAEDYLNTVREYLEGKQLESMDGVAPGTKMFTSEDGVDEGKTGPGLWANIHAKRERIKHGSGERMRKPGSKGAPKASDFRAAGSGKK